MSSGSRHQRNRSLDSVLQKIPELESDSNAAAAAAADHRSGEKTLLLDSGGGHPPLKPSLSLSLDPSSNLFRLRDNRRLDFLVMPSVTVESDELNWLSLLIVCVVEIQFIIQIIRLKLKTILVIGC